MNSLSNAHKIQGFRTCTSSNQKDQEKQAPVHFARFTYRLSNFNTLESFYVPQQQNQLLQLEGTRQQSISFCPDKITFPQTKNNILTTPNIINNYQTLNPFSINNKITPQGNHSLKHQVLTGLYNNQNRMDSGNTLNMVRNEKRYYSGKFIHPNEKYINQYKFQESSQKFNKKSWNQNIRQESSNLLQKYEIQSVSNLLNQQSCQMKSHQESKKRRSDPYINDHENDSRNRKRNSFSIKRQEISSRYQCPDDMNQNEHKQIAKYLEYMSQEINQSLQEQNTQLFIKQWIKQAPKYQTQVKCEIPFRHRQISNSRKMKQKEKQSKKQEQNEQHSIGEVEMQASMHQNESNVIMSHRQPSMESQENKLPTFEAIFNYSGHESAFPNEDEQQLFQLNQFLLN